jgi:hypothetical protein
VLILVEIVHTVVLSLRAHRLAAQPFIIVGLVAVIRRILFVLSSEVKVNTTELGLLIAMLVAFVASFITVSWFERRALMTPPGSPDGRANRRRAGGPGLAAGRLDHGADHETVAAPSPQAREDGAAPG